MQQYKRTIGLWWVLSTTALWPHPRRIPTLFLFPDFDWLSQTSVLGLYGRSPSSEFHRAFCLAEAMQQRNSVGCRTGGRPRPALESGQTAHYGSLFSVSATAGALSPARRTL